NRPAAAALSLLLLLLLLREILRPRRARWLGCGLLQHLVTFAVESGPDPHVHREALARVSFVDAAHRGDVAVVAAVGQPDVPYVHFLAHRRIQAEPASARQEDLGPGVRRHA